MESALLDTWKNRIKDTVFSKRYVGCEINGDLYVAIVYAKQNGIPIYLYGNMDNMDCFVNFFEAKGFEVKGIINRLYNDSNERAISVLKCGGASV